MKFTHANQIKENHRAANNSRLINRDPHKVLIMPNSLDAWRIWSMLKFSYGFLWECERYMEKTHYIVFEFHSPQTSPLRLDGCLWKFLLKIKRCNFAYTFFNILDIDLAVLAATKKTALNKRQVTAVLSYNFYGCCAFCYKFCLKLLDIPLEIYYLHTY